MLEHVHCEQRQEQRREDGYDSTKYEEAHCNHESVRKSRHAESGRESPRSYLTGEELGSHRRDYGRLVVALEIERDSEIVLISAQTGRVKMAPKPLLR